MRRVRLMIAGLLVGVVAGALAVWVEPGGLGREGEGDPLIADTRRICEAVLADDPASWERVRKRYFADEERASKLLEAAKAQSDHFRSESRIVSLRRSAEGESGDRRLVAVECLARTPAGDRTLTLQWERARGEPWQLVDLLGAPAVSRAPVGGEVLPAAAEGDGKPRPQDH